MGNLPETENWQWMELKLALKSSREAQIHLSSTTHKKPLSYAFTDA